MFPYASPGLIEDNITLTLRNNSDSYYSAPVMLGVAQEEENEFHGQPLSQPESPLVIATHF